MLASHRAKEEFVVAGGDLEIVRCHVQFHGGGCIGFNDCLAHCLVGAWSVKHLSSKDSDPFGVDQLGAAHFQAHVRLGHHVNNSLKIVEPLLPVRVASVHGVRVLVRRKLGVLHPREGVGPCVHVLRVREVDRSPDFGGCGEQEGVECAVVEGGGHVRSNVAPSRVGRDGDFGGGKRKVCEGGRSLRH